MIKLVTLLLFSVLMFNYDARAQCCSGGAGSPIAGGYSQGVLSGREVELNTNFRFVNTDQFFTGDKKDTTKYFDSFRSSYQYFRLAYGVTKRLTMSVEAGNYFYKEEIGMNNDPARTYSSSGFGDLILFPRYEVYRKDIEGRTTELTLGMGVKIPIGSYNDSTGNVEPFSGSTYYVTNPQAVQVTSGANDFIFYLFYLKTLGKKDFKVFANGFYISKGWNPLGEKMGDYASVSLFVSRSFVRNLGTTLQIRGEWTNQMSINKDILMFAYPNYDPLATGYKKVFVIPQLSYSLGKFTFFALADIPVYQYVTKTQVGTELQITAGASFRFLVPEQPKPVNF